MSADPVRYAPSAADRLRWFFRRWRERLFPRESNLVFHARTELKAAGLADKDSAYDGMLAGAVMELVKVFAKQGHSGNSAAIVRQLFDKVAAYQPLCPLTGGDEEWTEIGGPDYMKWQNKRCSHVFKRADGTAYDGEGRIFREPNGSCYTSRDSSVDITFPYTPKREYVDVPFAR